MHLLQLFGLNKTNYYFIILLYATCLPLFLGTGSLRTCMDVTLRTGQTASPRSTTLATLSWKTQQGEPVTALLQIQGKKEETEAVQKECSSIIHHALLEADADSDRRFDGTLKELNGFLKGISLAQKIEEVHMVLALLDREDTLHVSHAGRGEAYILRNGTASQITEYTGGRPVSAFVHVASGKLEARDIVVFSTQRLLRAMTPAQLANFGQRSSRLLEEILRVLDAEHEPAAVAVLVTPQSVSSTTSFVASRRSTHRTHGLSFSFPFPSLLRHASSWKARCRLSLPLPHDFHRFRASWTVFFSLFTDQKSRKRAHLLLLAGTIGTILLLWIGVQLLILGRRTHTREELEGRMEQVTSEIASAENRYLAGDTDGANVILQRAEERARQILDNSAGFFRVESLNLLDQVRMKREEMNNVSRLSPRTLVNIGTKTPSVLAQGLLRVGDGEFMAYDRQNVYRIVLNSVEDPSPITHQDIVVGASSFARFQTLAFLTEENGIIELQGGQATMMKTEDPSGWAKGKDIESFLRYLYLLVPEKKQIFKYERLSNRYGPAIAYNVNGDLSRAIDMAIDTYVYILQEGGGVLKLLRGESQPFTIQRLPEGALKTATKMFKVPNGNLYFLDPSQASIIVVADNPATNDAQYLRQYIIEGEQVGKLRDLSVDPDEAHLYLLDEKRVYVIDLQKK